MKHAKLVSLPTSDVVDIRQYSGDAFGPRHSRAEPVSRLRPADECRYRGPSEAFVSLTRNPSLESPSRFEPTVKNEGDVVL
jgi:hypothetical protein